MNNADNAKAKALGKYKGRKINLLKYQKIIDLLKKDLSHRQICDLLKCSPSTIQSAIKWHGNVDKEQLSFTKILQKSK